MGQKKPWRNYFVRARVSVLSYFARKIPFHFQFPSIDNLSISFSDFSKFLNFTRDESVYCIYLSVVSSDCWTSNQQIYFSDYCFKKEPEYAIILNRTPSMFTWLLPLFSPLMQLLKLEQSKGVVNYSLLKLKDSKESTSF